MRIIEYSSPGRAQGLPRESVERKGTAPGKGGATQGKTARSSPPAATAFARQRTAWASRR